MPRRDSAMHAPRGRASAFYRPGGGRGDGGARRKDEELRGSLAPGSSIVTATRKDTGFDDVPIRSRRASCID